MPNLFMTNATPYNSEINKNIRGHIDKKKRSRSCITVTLKMSRAVTLIFGPCQSDDISKHTNKLKFRKSDKFAIEWHIKQL